MAQTIVIGAGISGLTCALLLARSGRKVLVLEQHSSPAPVITGFRRAGIYFDSGFHYAGGLGEGGPLRLFLQHLGIIDQLEFFPYNREGFDRLFISATGEEYALPTGFSAVGAYLCQQFPAARELINAYLAEVMASWRNFPYLDLNLALTDFGMETVHGPSLEERLKVFAPWPALQGLLSMHSLLYGVVPAEASINLNAQVSGSYFDSVHGIVGGGASLGTALMAQLDELGVVIRCKALVTKILTRDGAISGVALATGQTFAANEVIATINPTNLPELLPSGGLRPAYLKRLKSLRQTPSAYILFARSRQSLDCLRGSNLFVQQQPGMFNSGAEAPLVECSFYLAAADQGQAGALNGLIGIVPAYYAEVSAWHGQGATRTEGYRLWKKALGERLLEMVRRRCPQLPPLELLDLATPLTLRDYSLAPEGAIYGVGRFQGQYNPHPATRLPGLYLSGQAVAAPGLLGAMAASYLTCGTILGHETLRGELRACC